MFLGGSISASLHVVSLHFPCSMHGSGLSFWRECLLADLLSNCSISWFIASWKSFMNSIWSALWLTSDELSSSSNSSDHFHDLGVASSSPLFAILLQYSYSTLLSSHVSLLTGITGLAPMYLVEFLPPLSLLLQSL